MSDAEFCQSLMCAVAGTFCHASWGVSAIHPMGLLLLWDDRPQAALHSVESVASAHGELLTAAGIEWGPHGRPTVGALVRPHGGDLADAAAKLKAHYAETTPAAGETIE